MDSNEIARRTCTVSRKRVFKLGSTGCGFTCHISGSHIHRQPTPIQTKLHNSQRPHYCTAVCSDRDESTSMTVYACFAALLFYFSALLMGMLIAGLFRKSHSLIETKLNLLQKTSITSSLFTNFVLNN